ncbi:MAG: anaerobic ribonucleoside-triphosphate reductase activating protein [Candidatus Lokiarchaeota archaeon]
MKIGGIIDISTKDIPGKASMVIFTMGCNFRCNFCHNKHLLKLENGKDISIEKLLNIIKSNQLVNSISISGGEPTLQKDLIILLRRIKEIKENETRKYISIDTNGSNPEYLKNLIPYLDRVALDIKAPLHQTLYEKITQSKIDINKIKKSYSILNSQKDLDFEIRTTYVKNLIQDKDIHEIINFLINNDFKDTFVLQQYQFSDGVGVEYKEKYQKPEHFELINILKPYSKERESSPLSFDIFIRDDVVGYLRLEDVLKMII